MLMPVKHEPIDWPTVINDLVHGGFTMASIGASIGRRDTTVNGWRNAGAEPKYNNGGRQLVLLWCREMNREESALPRKNSPLPKPTGFRRTSWIQLTLIEGNEIHNCDHTCKIC